MQVKTNHNEFQFVVTVETHFETELNTYKHDFRFQTKSDKHKNNLHKLAPPGGQFLKQARAISQKRRYFLFM